MGKDGTILRLADFETDYTHHVRSQHDGGAVRNASIGIEIEGVAGENNIEANPKQNAALLRFLLQEFALTKDDVTNHRIVNRGFYWMDKEHPDVKKLFKGCPCMHWSVTKKYQWIDKARNNHVDVANTYFTDPNWVYSEAENIFESWKGKFL